jgi:hypothetical protein
MGGEQFEEVCFGKTAEEAFRTAVEQAAYEFGHAGYTGTIAEKTDFNLFPYNPKGKSPKERMEELENEVDDKWGPAGCIEIPKELWSEEELKSHKEKRKFIFFGWASS